MPKLSVAKRPMFPANAKQFFHVRKNLLLLAGSSGFCECIIRIANPSSGEIAPVVWVAASRHPNFIAIVKLRNTPQSQCQPERQLQPCRGAAFGARKAGYVV